MAHKDSRKGKFVNKLPFPIADMKKISYDEFRGDLEGIVGAVFNQKSDDTSRRMIKDDIHIIPWNVFKQKLDEQVNDIHVYDDIAERDADPQSTEAGTISFVKDVSADPLVGRAIWGMYIYVLPDYILFATEEDIFYTREQGTGVVSISTGNFQAIDGLTAEQLSGLTITKFLEEMLWNTRASVNTPNSCTLVITNIANTIEVGDSTPWEVDATYDRGLIENGDGTVGPVLTGLPTSYTYININASVSAPQGSGLTDSYVAPAIPAVLGNNIMLVDVDYPIEASAYIDKFGNPSTALDSLRGADFCQEMTIQVEAFYRMYFGIDEVAPVNSAEVRAGQFNYLDIDSKGIFYITIPAGTLSFWVSIPTGVIFRPVLEESNLGMFEDFILNAFNVDDAGATPVAYDNYNQIIGGIGYANDVTYKIIVR